MAEVFVLGGGTPTPTEFRFVSAHAVRKIKGPAPV